MILVDTRVFLCLLELEATIVLFLRFHSVGSRIGITRVQEEKPGFSAVGASWFVHIRTCFVSCVVM
jgi:hypothetical protein